MAALPSRSIAQLLLFATVIVEPLTDEQFVEPLVSFRSSVPELKVLALLVTVALKPPSEACSPIATTAAAASATKTERNLRLRRSTVFAPLLASAVARLPRAGTGGHSIRRPWRACCNALGQIDCRQQVT